MEPRGPKRSQSEADFARELREKKRLLAALLVHDLRTGPPAQEHPWQDEAYAAAHGGLWRAAYSPRSALGLAVFLGFGSTRG